REKAQSGKNNGHLEIVEATESLEKIGGLDVLKDWLLKRRNAFTQKARSYGLPTPKGLLIIGIPGTGKSLTAKATAKVFGVPLLKMDAGKLFAGLVGQSESNLRSVIQTAEAIAPCCLWIDEIEKGFAGSKSSGSTDRECVYRGSLSGFRCRQRTNRSKRCPSPDRVCAVVKTHG